jgi:hypothetical protein
MIEYREDRRHRLTSDKVNKYKNMDTFTGSNEIGFIDSGTKLSYFEKVYFFVKAPVVKFLYNQVKMFKKKKFEIFSLMFFCSAVLYPFFDTIQLCNAL